jgi:ribonuclease HI
MANTDPKAQFDKMRCEIWVSGTATADETTGGWGAIMISHIAGIDYTKRLAGYSLEGATVTRMTLKAVAEALNQIKQPMFVHFYTTLPQVSAGLNRNIHRWAKKDFTKEKGQQLHHEDLWREVYDLLAVKCISYKCHFQKESPDRSNNIRVIHTASEYAMKAKKQIFDVAIAQ